VPGQGPGKRLVAHACDWAFARGYDRVRLRSGVQREAAHAFYEHLGFAKAKASDAFELRKFQARRSAGWRPARSRRIQEHRKSRSETGLASLI
jgi:ribosomal protein S18 acetylase RimI-like enzyme